MSGAALVARRAITGIKTVYSPRKIVTNHVSSGLNRYFSVTQSRNMKLLQFAYPNSPDEVRAGYLVGEEIVDIQKNDSSVPRTLLEILQQGYLSKVQAMQSNQHSSIPLKSVILKAPIHGMDKVLCVGLNYEDHCTEQKLTPPKVPMIFSKFASCIIGPQDSVKLRMEVTQKVDWEVEMVLVIGSMASEVKAEQAYNHILGYTVAQDISARDWQKERNGGQFLLGKAMDTFCPIGPWIVTADEIGDPNLLVIQCSLNGTVKQKSNTRNLIHKIPSLIERISSVMTLFPGDIILTGTPGGVGMYRNPPEYLKPGDTIVSEVQNIGVLTTKIEKYNKK